MVDAGYVPERGDIVWIDFMPQAGHEQARRRPAVVISPSAYNEKVGLALFCPITSKIKGYPFEVSLPDAGSVRGVILADQIKSLDWRARRSGFADHATRQVVDEVVGKIRAILEQKGR